MQLSSVSDKLTFLVGDQEILGNMSNLPARAPFDDIVVEFLNACSKNLMRSPESKAYPDVYTLGFWMRKSSIMGLKDRFPGTLDSIRVGRGVVFHIAPSNVAVNYAYSLVSGLITGNANVVRVPSKDFPQVGIINRVINETLKDYPQMAPYIALIKYGRDGEVNDLLSSMADVRVIWGGDNTIEEIRKSPLGPRAGEITFADRYSIAVIDSDTYMAREDKKRIAEDFYNDTFLSDQNACTSPRLVVWTGSSIEEAKKMFWDLEYELVKSRYTFQPIMGINKLTSSYIAAAVREGVKIAPSKDNLIKRVQVASVDSELMDLKDNSGYFFEYDCKDLLDLRDICDNTHCQTISFMGDKEQLMPLLTSGIKGVDRVVPIGKTMDFDLYWDGYNLVERLTRTVKIDL